MSEQPYLDKVTITKAFNPNYPYDNVCNCGHEYGRHFDWMMEDAPVGCKYCPCFTFVPQEIK